VTVPTLPSVSVNADIVSVTGAGSLTSESVIIQNNGDAPLLLTGWTLKDSQGSTYIFPQLTLYPAGAVQVHTGPGTDTAADLYWQRSAAVWKSGELVALYDAQNIARAFYRVP
jgi:micrococcal nuclease